MVWTTNQPVRTPEDFEGIKIRTMTSPILLEAYEAYGASPQAMPYGEVYSALQLNMIDAQVNPVFAIEEMSFYEVTSHMIFAKPAPFLSTLVANEDFLGGLSEEDQAMVNEVVAELEPFLWDLQERTHQERLGIIRDRKPEMKMIELSEAERDLFRERSRVVHEQFTATLGERGQELWQAWEAARQRAEEPQEAGD